jgi:hypothetical protein
MRSIFVAFNFLPYLIGSSRKPLIGRPTHPFGLPFLPPRLHLALSPDLLCTAHSAAHRACAMAPKPPLLVLHRWLKIDRPYGETAQNKLRRCASVTHRIQSNPVSPLAVAAGPEIAPGGSRYLRGYACWVRRLPQVPELLFTTRTPLRRPIKIAPFSVGVVLPLCLFIWALLF